MTFFSFLPPEIAAEVTALCSVMPHLCLAELSSGAKLLVLDNDNCNQSLKRGCMANHGYREDPHAIKATSFKANHEREKRVNIVGAREHMAIRSVVVRRVTHLFMKSNTPLLLPIRYQETHILHTQHHPFLLVRDQIDSKARLNFTMEKANTGKLRFCFTV